MKITRITINGKGKNIKSVEFEFSNIAPEIDLDFCTGDEVKIIRVKSESIEEKLITENEGRN